MCCFAENDEDRAFFRRQANFVNPKTEQVRYQPRFLCLPRPNRPPPGPLPLITPSPALRRRDRLHMAAGICIMIYTCIHDHMTGFKSSLSLTMNFTELLCDTSTEQEESCLV